MTTLNIICPRCGDWFEYPQARSRYRNVPICSQCGRDEAAFGDWETDIIRRMSDEIVELKQAAFDLENSLDEAVTKLESVMEQRTGAVKALGELRKRMRQMEFVIRELSSFDTIEPGPVQLPIDEEHFRRLHGRRIKFRLRSPDGNIYRSGEGVLRFRKGGEGWETSDGFNTLSTATSLEWMTELEVL